MVVRARILGEFISMLHHSMHTYWVDSSGSDLEGPRGYLITVWAFVAQLSPMSDLSWAHLLLPNHSVRANCAGYICSVNSLSSWWYFLCLTTLVIPFTWPG